MILTKENKDIISRYQESYLTINNDVEEEY